MNTQNDNASGNQFKRLLRNIYIAGTTFTLSLLLYFIVVINILPKTPILILGTILLTAICFALYNPEKVGAFNRKPFLIPLMLIVLIGISDTLMSARKPTGFKITKPDNSAHLEKLKELEKK